ncbi:hypothetical protein MKX03_034630 [Papaver bracteatum]|nr:hypothetical protein MKX03_034630 [Papaver bracteatum]
MDESFQSCANLLYVTGGLRTNHILGTVVVYLTPTIRGMKSWEKENISTEASKDARITYNDYMSKFTEKDTFHFRVGIVLLQLLVLQVVVGVSDVDPVGGDSFDPWTKTKRKFSRSLSKERK